MNAKEYAELAGRMYAEAKKLTELALGSSESSALLVIAYHLNQAARVARESAEAKARSLSEATAAPE